MTAPIGTKAATSWRVILREYSGLRRHPVQAPATVRSEKTNNAICMK